MVTFPMLAVLATANPLMQFVGVAIIVALLLYSIPRILPLDARAWTIIRAVVLITFVLYTLRLVGLI